MRKLCLLLALIMGTSLFCACKKEGGGQDISGLIAGFSLAGESIEGGGSVTSPNVKSVEFGENGIDYSIALQFISGSRMSGGAEESAVASVPQYKISLLEAPARLVVELPGLAYWDYTRTLDMSGAGHILGCFQYMTTDTGDASGDGGAANADAVEDTEAPPFVSAARICFQLAEEVAFKAETSGDTLIITLRTLPSSETAQNGDAEDVLAGKQFYVMGDAYTDYCDGVIPQTIQAAPTYAANLNSVVLLAGPFANEGSADNALEEIISASPDMVASEWMVILLSDNELPPYDETTRYSVVYNSSVVRRDGAESALGVFIEDGYLLCVTHERDGYLYSKRMVDTGVGKTSYVYQQIYCMDTSGNSREFLSYEFDTIERAEYSPDGRKLAVLAREAESAHLYIFDMDTKELLTDLSNMGFGDMVSAFTWDDTGSAIYAVSGSSEIQVNEYDFLVPAQNKRYSIVDRNGVDEGCIAYCNGELYFVETDMDDGPVIYRIKPEGGVRKAFTTGSSFALSPNDRYMAVSVSSSDFYVADAETSTIQPEDTFSIYDMTSGEATVVTEDFAVYEYLWSWDSSKLYFFEDRLTGNAGEGESSTDEDTAQTERGTDPYPYTLWVYDVETGEKYAVADLPYTSIMVSNRQNEVYLLYYDEETGGGVIRATYTINVD